MTKMCKKGFTQIEMLLSMGIMMILIGVLTTVFGQILDVQLESKSISSVDQNARYLLARLTHDMQAAQSIVTPATPGQVTNTLQITVNSINYTYSASPSGNFVLSNSHGTDVLNSDAASISAVTFKRIGNGTESDTVQVSFTVSTRTNQVSGVKQKSYQTTLGLQ